MVPGPFVGQADTCPREFYKAVKNVLVRYPLAQMAVQELVNQIPKSRTKNNIYHIRFRFLISQSHLGPRSTHIMGAFKGHNKCIS